MLSNVIAQLAHLPAILASKTSEEELETPPKEDSKAADTSKVSDEPPGENDQTVPMSELKKIRRESQKYRTELRETQAALEDLNSKVKSEREEAEMSKLEEVEQLKARAAKAQASLVEMEAVAVKAQNASETLSKRFAVFAAASQNDFIAPDDASAMLDLTQVPTVDGKLDVEAITEMVKELAESKPYLVNGGGKDARETFGGSTNPPPSKDAYPDVKLTDEDTIARMKKQAVEQIHSGNMSAAVSLYNRAWEKERGIKTK